jgi:glycosyltransferase involved in cell wall biosynthesis
VTEATVWNDCSIALILPTYREKATIRDVIRGFEKLGVVDDIVVVNNNAEPGTSEQVAGTSAREVFESYQGYGAAIQRGLAETDADLVCICEPDATFEPSDLWKLLAYSGDFDFVYGSRTVPEFIWSGANMGAFLRWGNWAVAKLIEVTFNTPSLSDVGCTMRLVSGPAARSLLPHYTLKNNAFGPEMMLLSIIGGWRIVQLPVNFRGRKGGPGTTESFNQAVGIGLRMIRLILRYRFRKRAVARSLFESGIKSHARWSSEDARPGGEPAPIFPPVRRMRQWRPMRRSSNKKSR